MSDAVKAASPGSAAQLVSTSTPSTVATAATGNSASGSSTGSTILLQTPPPAISALNVGQVIRAVAAGRTADGKTLLDTRFGQLVLDLPFHVVSGQVLRLQIVRNGAALELALLTTSDGDEEQRRPIDFAQLRPGTELRGSHTPRAPADAHASIRPRAPAPEHAGIKPRGPAEPHADVRPHGAGARITGPAPTRLGLRVLSVTLPGKAPASLPHHDLVLTGTVTSSTRGGTVVQTQTGTLFLPGIVNAPKGAQVALQILGTPGTVLPMTQAGAQAQTISALSHGWPTLQAAIETAHAADPAKAASIVADTVPTTGPRLTAGLALFLNAVFGARLSDWLGADMQRVLESQRRGDLLSRLDDDFIEFSRLAREPVGNDWRAVMLPLLHEGVLHQIRLYLRAHQDGGHGNGSAGEAEAGTRFVVEVELSRLGALQLDGLVRSKRFDLMVRTHRALPAHVRDEIAALFAAANEEMKASGQIGFQVMPEFAVAPLETVEGHSVGLFA